jgi:hypothetical protein
MVSLDALSVELRRVSERNLRESVGVMKGYLKFASMIWIRALRQPILDGILVKRWNSDASRALQRLCERHRRDEVLLRFDSMNQRWSKRRGGYIIPRSRARALMMDLEEEGKIGAFLEPLSPYQDRYSLAAVTDGLQETIWIEVVGPGFDASDLLRSDSFPHERFEVSIPSETQGNQRLRFLDRPRVIEPDEYRRAAQARLLKIGARLKKPAYPKMPGSPSSQQARLASEAVDYLERTGQSTLLKHLHTYEPIPKRLIERFVSGVAAIIQGLDRHNIRLGATSFSGTFTVRGRFVFWDFFPADLASGKALYLGT